MPESQPLGKLATALKRLNEATEVLNQKIAEFEQTLLDMRPGITAWCSKFLTRHEDEGSVYASQLGFIKMGNKWGLWVRRGSFFEQFPGDWVPSDDPPQEYVRLVDSSREERMASLKVFDVLVKELAEVAQEHAETLERANKDSR